MDVLKCNAIHFIIYYSIMSYQTQQHTKISYLHTNHRSDFLFLTLTFTTMKQINTLLNKSENKKKLTQTKGT